MADIDLPNTKQIPLFLFSKRTPKNTYLSYCFPHYYEYAIGNFCFIFTYLLLFTRYKSPNHTKKASKPNHDCVLLKHVTFL